MSGYVGRTGYSDHPSWSCPYCKAGGRPIDVFLPDKVDDPKLFAEGLRWIREHMFGHLVDQMMGASDEELWEMCKDDEPDPVAITNEDAGPAVAEAGRIVREGAN